MDSRHELYEPHKRFATACKHLWISRQTNYEPHKLFAITCKQLVSLTNFLQPLVKTYGFYVKNLWIFCKKLVSLTNFLQPFVKTYGFYVKILFSSIHRHTHLVQHDGISLDWARCRGGNTYSIQVNSTVIASSLLVLMCNGNSRLVHISHRRPVTKS